MDVSTLKWLLALSLFTLALMGGVAPIRFKKKDPNGRYLALGNMLSGGIFLGGGLMHLLPEAHEGLQEVTKELNSFLSSFPCAYFLAAVGFFTILSVEEIVLASTHVDKDKPSSSAASGSVPGSATGSSSSRRSITYPSSPSISRHANHTHAPYTPPAGQVHAAEQNRSFLKLYFTKRTLARSIVQSLTPRSVLVPADSRSALREADVMAPSTPVHHHRRHLDIPSTSAAPITTTRTSIIKPSSRTLTSYAAPATSTAQPLLAAEHPVRDVGAEMSLKTRDVHVHMGEDMNATAPDAWDMDSDTENEPETPSSHGHGHGNDGTKSDEHDHAHFDLDSSSTVVAYLLVLALSFHSIFEGIALGTQEHYANTVSLFIAIAAHTPLAGFALGVSLVKAKATTRMHLTCIVLFSLMTPCGAIAGLLMSYFLKGSVLVGVSAGFQAFSAGTFLFVALEEIIPKELANPRDKMWKLILCMIGFAGMAAIKMVDR